MTEITEVETICRYLKKRGYEPLSIDGHYVQLYKKGNILVKVEDKEKKP